MLRAELLTPKGDSRLVVEGDVAARLIVERGYILIEETDLKVTHGADEFGFEAAAIAEVVEEVADESDDVGESEGVANTSLDYTAKDAVLVIAELESAEAINIFASGDDRKTVAVAGGKRLDELELENDA